MHYKKWLSLIRGLSVALAVLLLFFVFAYIADSFILRDGLLPCTESNIIEYLLTCNIKEKEGHWCPPMYQSMRSSLPWAIMLILELLTILSGILYYLIKYKDEKHINYLKIAIMSTLLLILLFGIQTNFSQKCAEIRDTENYNTDVIDFHTQSIFFTPEFILHSLFDVESLVFSY